IEYLHAHTRQVAAWWADGFDLLLTPTLPEPPPRLGEFDPAPGDPLRGFTRGGAFVAFTMPFNVTGQPAISLPLYWSTDGRAIGVPWCVRSPVATGLAVSSSYRSPRER